MIKLIINDNSNFYIKVLKNSSGETEGFGQKKRDSKRERSERCESRFLAAPDEFFLIQIWSPNKMLLYFMSKY